MKKETALAYFRGRKIELARAVGISRAAVHGWRETISERQRLQVIGALLVALDGQGIKFIEYQLSTLLSDPNIFPNNFRLNLRAEVTLHKKAAAKRK